MQDLDLEYKGQLPGLCRLTWVLIWRQLTQTQETCSETWTNRQWSRSEDKWRLVSRSNAVSHIPQRASAYYQTNNRKLCWQCSKNSNNPHPCVPLGTFLCWLNLTTSFRLVSPQTGMARGSATLNSAAGYCSRHIVTQDLVVSPLPS